MYLQLIDKCDSFPYSFTVSRLFVGGEAVGYLRDVVVEALREFPDFKITPADGETFRVSVHGDVTRAIAEVAALWRQQKRFTCLEGWRDELYTVYLHNRVEAFKIERAACGLFGVVTYGAHLNVYQPSPLKVWIPRRSSTKATFPGMLDNSVAGGISNGLSPYETIVKEALEEASIPESISRKLVKSAGCISYVYVTEDGWIQPEVQYVFDMPLLPPYQDLTLRTNDGEAEDFKLLTVEEVNQELKMGNFKPNCAAVMIDFFIRHGIVTEDGSGDVIRMQQRLHRSFEFPV